MRREAVEGGRMSHTGGTGLGLTRDLMWVQGILRVSPGAWADPRHYKGASKYLRQILLVIGIDEEPSPGSGHSAYAGPSWFYLPEEI